MALDSKRFDDVTDTRMGKKVPSFNTDTRMGPLDKPDPRVEAIIRRLEPQLGKPPKSGSASLSRSPLPENPPSGKHPAGSGKNKNVPANIQNAAKRRLAGQ